MSESVQQTSVLFVCLGNICRSPTAEGVFRHLVRQCGQEHAYRIDSCGTGAYHVGEPPDRRARQEAQRRGLSLDRLRARGLEQRDFECFDYLVAMDDANYRDLKNAAPQGFHGHIVKLLDFAAEYRGASVPDPYYGGDDGFSKVFAMVEQGCQGLIEHIEATRR
ncbi:low molecular weight protein-tyrosine-phosphatase [Carnimonas nigrificans]|uniref:low molecular weight protein-tyrosine-phosphatase n=1 Tax=Carnimonas nigrificans TaxID=64323 RepID=UPI0004B89B49|nr:low molecular weight protein-tyrosine-phosphatase [Carnimonas nigrificans]